MRRLGAVLAFSLLLFACSNAQPELAVSAARISTPIAGSAQIALSITNSGSGDDELIEVSTPSAAFVEIHETTVTDGRAVMAKRDTVALPSRQTVLFRPGGLHLMLLVPDPSVVPGAQIPVTVTFRAHPPITLHAEVVDLLDLVAFGDELEDGS